MSKPTGRPPKPAWERFWKFVDKCGEDECWNWIGGIGKGGYGLFWINELHADVHSSRASWMIHYGDIPDGMFVCHHCDNPACVNPKHLFLGTNKDNMQDMIAKGRRVKCFGTKHGNHGTNCWENKLSPEQVREIRHKYSGGGTSMYKLAREYGVGYSTINYLINRRNWAWLE